MWGKTTEGQTQPQGPAPPANRPPAASVPPAVQQAPAPPPPTPTMLGSSMKIVGEVFSDDELYLDGDLEGKLELKNRLTIGPHSKVSANIKAKEVVVFGTVRGNVESETRVSLRAGASIVGDIKTAGIVIDDGAYFKGGIDITRGDAANHAPKATGTSAGRKG